MSRRLLLILVAALTLGLAAVAQAKTKTSLTKTSVESVLDGESSVSGFVVSSRERCHNGRKVVLYKLKGRSHNPRRDKRIGSDKATPNGDGSQYRISFTGFGKYYAYVGATKNCSSAYSRTVTLVKPKS